MPTLTTIFCETRPHTQEPAEWTGEARFLLDPPGDLLGALHAAHLHDLGHPDDLSVQVSAEALFEDGEITGRTVLSAADLATLTAHLPEAHHARVLAWAAFAYALEGQGNDARFVIWFVE
ncbi:hypothetical protein [Deinococcus sp. JMULE3]|uniref:hypothetical protein n=1 Tax=Deinococcus sp. JMULE3 TaxID=2518341 RepID=UPI0015765B94|nr:hypothetical protein [Deinococcus sp. JMULE3]NTX99707.1 hypothetical protein [Deinococcus sp. JMULE3]